MKRYLFDAPAVCLAGNRLAVAFRGSNERIGAFRISADCSVVGVQQDDAGEWSLLLDSDLRHEWGENSPLRAMYVSSRVDAEKETNVAQAAAGAIEQVDAALRHLGYAACFHGSNLTVEDCKESIDRIGEAVKSLAQLIRDNLGDKA